MAETLASTLNPSPFDPIGAAGSFMREASVEGRGKKAREIAPEVMRQESMAQENVMREEAGAKRRQVEEETKIEQGFAKGVETAGRQLETAFGGMPEYQITAFETERGMELAGLTALMGAFAGAVSGRAGLAAMEGVSEGYRKGQEDLYKRQVDTYNAEVDKYKQKINEAKQIYDNAIKLETARRGAGMVELKKLEPLLQDSVITARARVNDFKGIGALINDAIKLSGELDVKRAEAGLKQKAGKLPSDLEKSYNKIAPTYERFSSLNKGIKPSYFGITFSEGVGRALMKAVEVDLSPAIVDAIKKKYPGITDDQILWWKQYDQFIAKVRNELFGATLTKAEKENFDRTVISPATKPELAQKYFTDQVRIIETALNREIRKGLILGFNPDVIASYLGLPVERVVAVDKPREFNNPQELAAFNWATANPDDPRSVEILQKLGL